METLYSIRFEKKGNIFFYIGKTKNFSHRIKQHLDKCTGAKWIQGCFSDRERNEAVPREIAMYSVEDILWAETKETLASMLKYGANNVRGAEYCQPELYSQGQITNIGWAIKHHLCNDQNIHAITKKLNKLNSRMVQASPSSQIVSNDQEKVTKFIKNTFNTRRQCRNCFSDSLQSHEFCLKCWNIVNSMAVDDELKFTFGITTPVSTAPGTSNLFSDSKFCSVDTKPIISKFNSPKSVGNNNCTERLCENCYVDISSRPSPHHLCYKCWKSN